MMRMLSAIYFDGYARSEAEALSREGLFVAQIESQPDAISSLPKLLSNTARVFMRGPKLKPGEYSTVFKAVNSFGILPTTTPRQYEVLSDSGLYEESILNFVPPKKIFDCANRSRAQEALLQLRSWSRIFIRSELGSAAKSAGLDACIIEEFTDDAVRQKVDALVGAFPKAERIIARKVENVRKVEQQTAEGRFVVLGGRVAYLDHCEISQPIEAKAFFDRNVSNAEQVAQLFSSRGIDGDYFLDIAEKDGGGWFVVEVKPAFNGTIRQLDQLAEALQLAK